jgi:hypothetical protein
MRLHDPLKIYSLLVLLMIHEGALLRVPLNFELVIQHNQFEASS